MALHSGPIHAHKAEVCASGAVVTCLHPLAADAAIETLAGGGNAVDAAIAAAFVLGVVEPMMSGVGGGGVMVARMADGRTVVIDHSARAPLRATADMFEIIDGGAAAGFYGWPAVRDDENIVGPRSVSTPGMVAGLALAAERLGVVGFDRLVAPAIRLAESGFPIDWFTSSTIASELRHLRKCPAAIADFAPDGLPQVPAPVGQQTLVTQADLARTLRRIARDGASEFYAGETADKIVNGLGPAGLLSREDLASYRPRVYEGDATKIGSYRGLAIHGAPFEGGAVTTAEILGILDHVDLESLEFGSAEHLHHIAEASRRAFADRFALLADHEVVDAPWNMLRDRDYLRKRAAGIRPDAATPHVFAGSAGTHAAVGHTTHLNVVDRDRNVVALTETLLDHFGSRVIAPGTGVFLNDGMMWFDPRAGRPNSIAGGKWPLTAMSPLIFCRDDEPVLVVGGSGGRKIMTAVAQVVSAIVDFGIGPQAAVEGARIHCDGPTVLIDARVPSGTRAEFTRLGHEVSVLEPSPNASSFSLPNAIAINGEDDLRGGVDALRPGTARGLI